MNPLLCLIVKLKNKIMKILFNIIIIYSIVFPGHAFSDQAQFVRNSDSLDVNNDDDDFCDDDFKTLTINDDFEKLKGLHNSGYKISITCRRSLGDI